MNGFHFLVSTLCVKEIRDTQCGFKLLDRTAAKLVFIPMHIERWGFDVEILYIAIRHHLTIKVRNAAYHAAIQSINLPLCRKLQSYGVKFPAQN